MRMHVRGWGCTETGGSGTKQHAQILVRLLTPQAHATRCKHAKQSPPWRTAVPFSKKLRASSAKPRYASSSNQPSLVMRQSSWMRDVATNGSNWGPRLRGGGWLQVREHGGGWVQWEEHCVSGPPLLNALLHSTRNNSHPHGEMLPRSHAYATRSAPTH